MYNKLFTGYFAKTKKYIEMGYTPVSVAGKTPDFLRVKNGQTLPPEKNFSQLGKRAN